MTSLEATPPASMPQVFRSPGQQGAIGLLRAADLVRRAYVRVVGKAGLTLQQYNVLRILRGAGPEGLPTLSIAERMIEHDPGVTRLIDRLVAKGLVRRRRTSRDRRRVLCSITQAGLELLGRLDEPVSRADDDVLSMLGEEGQLSLIALLDRVRAGHDESRNRTARTA